MSHEDQGAGRRRTRGGVEDRRRGVSLLGGRASLPFWGLICLEDMSEGKQNLWTRTSKGGRERNQVDGPLDGSTSCSQ